MNLLRALCICTAQFLIGFLIGYMFMRLMQWLFGVAAAAWIGLIVAVALMGWFLAIVVPTREVTR